MLKWEAEMCSSGKLRCAQGAEAEMCSQNGKLRCAQVGS